MSLATRLSAFFLLALALVLAGFSGTLYILARTYLIEQLDERLQHALETLEASVDIEPGGLEWEPADRQMNLGVEPGPGAVRWVVRDGRGNPVDHSPNADLETFPSKWLPAQWPSDPADTTAFSSFRGWRLAARRLELEDLLKRGRGSPADQPGYEVQYPALVLVAGLSPLPVEATLRWLGWTLSLLSLGIWILLLVAGRWLCGRALSPVIRMARAATSMTAAELGRRLPMSGTGDELDALGRAFNDLLDRLHEAFVRLHAAYDRQHRFAGNASHQLRTPLAALLGQVQVALRRDRPVAEYQRVLERVQDEGTRLRQIVESLLLLAQPEGVRPEPEVLDVESWVAVELRRWGRHPRAIDMRVETAGSGPFNVRVHPPLFAQLFDNLLENACKYSAPGTPVVIKVGREQGSVLLGVEDRGCGLATEDLPFIFEPFFRGKQAQRDGHAGTGLGLAVAQQIANAFGGLLEVRSEPEAGCFFLVCLPEIPSVGPAMAQQRCETRTG